MSVLFFHKLITVCFAILTDGSEINSFINSFINFFHKFPDRQNQPIVTNSASHNFSISKTLNFNTTQPIIYNIPNLNKVNLSCVNLSIFSHMFILYSFPQSSMTILTSILYRKIVITNKYSYRNRIQIKNNHD